MGIIGTTFIWSCGIRIFRRQRSGICGRVGLSMMLLSCWGLETATGAWLGT